MDGTQTIRLVSGAIQVQIGLFPKAHLSGKVKAFARCPEGLGKLTRGLGEVCGAVGWMHGGTTETLSSNNPLLGATTCPLV